MENRQFLVRGSNFYHKNEGANKWVGLDLFGFPAHLLVGEMCIISSNSFDFEDEMNSSLI